MESPSFKKYLSKFHEGKIDAAIERFVASNKECITEKSDKLDRVYEYTYAESSILHIWAENKKGVSFPFWLLVKSNFELEGQRGRDHEAVDDVDELFAIHCSIDLSKHDGDFKTGEVEVYEEKHRANYPMDDRLIPYIDEKDFDEKAERILAKYLPEALKEPTQVDIWKLAKNLELNVIDRYSLSLDDSVVGECIFKEKKVTVYDRNTKEPICLQVQADSILLDKNVFFLFNDGSIRFTLAHEIMHYIFHKKRIYLEFLYHDGLSGLKCSNEMIDDVDTSEDLPLLEWQANRLAARVLAPKTTFIEKIEDLKTYYSSLGFSSFFPDIVEMLIEDLASFFGISKQATKIRLIDLGYDGAIEAFTFIDGHYVAPVGFSKGSLDRDESYSVGVKDLIIAKLFNPDLAKGFEEGKLIYVDHHVCLNEPKYLDKDSSGRTILSDYAKYTAQECLLKFTIKISGKYSRSSYCTLFREFGGIEANYTFSAEANKSAKAKADAILGRKREINALLNMVDESSFGNSLKSLMKHLNISNETMAEKLKVSVQTIKNYKSGETEQPKSNLAYALCLILDVPFIVCQKLLNTAGLSVPTGTNRGAIISFYMDNPGSSIKECNEQLKAIGEEPLIGDDDE